MKRLGTRTWKAAKVWGGCTKFPSLSPKMVEKLIGKDLKLWATPQRWAWSIWNARNWFHFELN